MNPFLLLPLAVLIYVTSKNWRVFVTLWQMGCVSLEADDIAAERAEHPHDDPSDFISRDIAEANARAEYWRGMYFGAIDAAPAPNPLTLRDALAEDCAGQPVVRTTSRQRRDWRRR